MFLFLCLLGLFYWNGLLLFSGVTLIIYVELKDDSVFFLVFLDKYRCLSGVGSGIEGLV